MDLADTHRGIACTVGKAKLLIPAEFVAGVVELDIAPPPPLARKWVGGLGFHLGKAMICVSLGAPQQLVQSRRVKGVLLGLEESEIGWVLEVNEVKAFVEVTRLARKTPAAPGVPTWVGAAVDSTGQTFGWVDVLLMIRELVGTA